ncbi:hypothetical protein GO755_21720 [Spirosoma sp. HMF4905]|uniref:Uncharacterized protein n=1 Tax=Spirosoma arboris TaxID=2682092 RepID=A0A7K1SFT0_9BACT|nr:hypothetical protein [Spirosoma arboris]MVM32675.1 hypothetical protein [Spirosoma arboris]
MRQRLNPWAVILTAALTFGSLMAFVGPRSYGQHGWGYHGHHFRYSHHGCDGRHADKPTDKVDSSQTR